MADNWQVVDSRETYDFSPTGNHKPVIELHIQTKDGKQFTVNVDRRLMGDAGAVKDKIQAAYDNYVNVHNLTG